MASAIHDFSDDATVERALGILNTGGVVVLPTDTLYGLSAAVDTEAGGRRIDAIKGVPSGRGYVLLGDDLRMVSGWVESFGCTTESVLAAIWPAPLTAVLPAGPRCPRWSRPTVAFRVPDYRPLRYLIGRLGRPIISTSVNRSGDPPLDDADAISREFGSQIDLVVCDANRAARHSRGSTIVDFSGESPRVLREGDYDWAG